jgi:hypothetical protein
MHSNQLWVLSHLHFKHCWNYPIDLGAVAEYLPHDLLS